MKRILARAMLSLSMLLFALPPHAEELQAQPPVYTMSIEGEAFIGEDGALERYVPTSPLDDELRPKFLALMRSLRVEATSSESARGTEAQKVLATLVAHKRADGKFTARIENVTFPVKSEVRPVLIETVKPAKVSYPRAAAARKIEGRVLVYLRVNRAGEVTHASAVHSAVINTEGNDKTLAYLLRDFELHAVEGIRKSRYRVIAPEGVTPDAEQLTASIVVDFLMPDSSPYRAGEWALEVRSVRRPPPWREDTADSRISVSDALGSGLQPMLGAYRLASKLPDASL